MKIAVFGDSYGQRWTEGLGPSWVEILAVRGYNIVNYSLASSSVWYSWDLYQQHASCYDKVIFLATAPDRITLDSTVLPKNICHVSNPVYWGHDPGSYADTAVTVQEVNKIRQALIIAQQYTDSKTMNMLPYKLLINHIKSLSKPILLLPCYGSTRPLWSSLNPISQIDEKRFGINIQHYRDGRPAHLSPENNQILADRIQGWIDHGSNVDLNPSTYCQETALNPKDMFTPF
jgi:hypothetical protein